jgi:ribose transport system ATP-binding protein
MDTNDVHAGPRNRSSGLLLTELSKSYGGVRALSEATIDCRRSEVHGLVGENGAGKSTLIKILAGAVPADDGTITLDGTPLRFRRPRDASRAGISVVFQELSLIPDLSVAANLFYSSEPKVRLGRINRRALLARAKEVLDRFECSGLDPRQTTRSLSLAERQIVEIVKALRREPDVLVLDEATSALSPKQVAWLQSTARRVAERGGVVLFVSHRLEEVTQFTDRLTVLRSGRNVGGGKTAEFSQARLVEFMLGRKIDRYYPQREESPSDDIAIELKKFFSGARVTDVNLQIRAGEIVGIAGLQGQGQLELFQAVYGVRRWTGEMLIKGSAVRVNSPAEAMRHGIGLVPEDRTSEGLCLNLSIRENLTLGSTSLIARFGLIRRQKEQDLIHELTEMFQISFRDPLQPTSSLSGGNQQKVLVGRVIARHPNVLLMYDATRGVDIGTKSQLFALMRHQCAQGSAVLFYSTDTAELVNMCDVVWVMHDGELRTRFAGDALTEENLIAAALGVSGTRDLATAPLDCGVTTTDRR